MVDQQLKPVKHVSDYASLLRATNGPALLEELETVIRFKSVADGGDQLAEYRFQVAFDLMHSGEVAGGPELWRLARTRAGSKQ